MNRRTLWMAAVAGALAIGGVLLFSSVAAAQEPSAVIGDATGGVGDEVSLDLQVLDIDAPGLAAWSIDVTWDSDVVSLTACEPAADVGNQVCNPEFDDETARAAGATASGLEGDSTLLDLSFECVAEGTSTIGIRLVTFADGTIGDPQPIAAEIENGSVTCGAEPGGLPDTPGGLPDSGQGAGASDGGFNYTWVIVGLAAAGIATLAIGYRSRRRA